MEKFKTNLLSKYILSVSPKVGLNPRIFSLDLDLYILVINKSFAEESSDQATPISS